MRLTMVGTGDAFGTGGRAHTCLRLDAGGSTIVVDFGASALSSWKKLGFSTNGIDAVIVSHLHGDHFGGLPFLLLDCQFVARRRQPLILLGPPGFRARLDMALEAMFPGSSALHWTFPWQAIDIRPGEPAYVAGFRLDTFEVIHPAGAPSTAVRLEGHDRVFAYSGDTSWTDALNEAARGADLFVVECFSGNGPVHAHLDWATLRGRLDGFEARRIVVTHMGETALALTDDMQAAGCTPGHDGLVVEF
ncbi:MAG: MBL fold metallo-hydrolase [Methylobacteriaceae bacterium]|nr:MBL fold metallo-hydrolase [Methylobacteriaceae bacterium]